MNKAKIFIARLTMILLVTTAFVGSANAGIQVGSIVRVLETNSSYKNLIGKVIDCNNVTYGLEVSQVVSTQAPYVRSSVIRVSVNEVRSTSSSDFKIHESGSARVGEKNSGLYLIYGTVLARDGRSAVFQAQRSMNSQPINYVLSEAYLEPVRKASVRPQPGDFVEIQNPSSNPLNGIQGEVIFQNGKEAVVRYKSNSGDFRENPFLNSVLKLVSMRIHPDFAPEFLSETFLELSKVSYAERKAIYTRIGSQIDRFAPPTDDPLLVSHSLWSRIFVLMALRPVFEYSPGELDESDILPAYRSGMQALLPDCVFHSDGKKKNSGTTCSLALVPYSEFVANAAAYTLDACMNAVRQTVSGEDAKAVSSLIVAIGTYTAAKKDQYATEQLLNAFRSQQPLIDKLSKTLNLVDVMLSIESVRNYLEKKI